MKSIRCESCRRFRKADDVAEIGGENQEWWIECVYCMSNSDFSIFFPDRERLLDMRIYVAEPAEL